MSQVSTSPNRRVELASIRPGATQVWAQKTFDPARGFGRRRTARKRAHQAVLGFWHSQAFSIESKPRAGAANDGRRIRAVYDLS